MNTLLAREMAVFGVYMPSVTLLLLITLAGSWLLDRGLAWLGLYEYVWHPTLFRVSWVTLIYGALALNLYF